LERNPTAHAFAGEIAVTLWSWFLDTPTFGLGRVAHVVPFHCSTRVRDTPAFIRNPTAHASVGASAATSCKKLSPDPTFGLGLIVHVAPFQCSTSVRNDEPLLYAPTAHASQFEIATRPVR